MLSCFWKQEDLKRRLRDVGLRPTNCKGTAPKRSLRSLDCFAPSVLSNFNSSVSINNHEVCFSVEHSTTVVFKRRHSLPSSAVRATNLIFISYRLDLDCMPYVPTLWSKCFMSCFVTLSYAPLLSRRSCTSVVFVFFTSVVCEQMHSHRTVSMG